MQTMTLLTTTLPEVLMIDCRKNHVIGESSIQVVQFLLTHI